MKISEHVLCAIDDVDSGKLDSAMLHACIAVDATSRRLFPNEQSVGKRFVACIREYYWLVEPCMAMGANLVDTRFTNVPLRRNPSPDFAEIIYEVFRCAHAHGDEVPPEFSMVWCHEGQFTNWEFSNNELHLPSRVIFALLWVAVLCKANAVEATTTDAYLSLDANRILVRDWWGLEDSIRPVAARYNSVRITFQGLHH
jgi:hypothetical protein